MIRINKGNAPATLVRAKRRYDLQNNSLYLTHTRDYNSGKAQFKFTDAYKSTDVKVALVAAQHDKCCFSEAKFVNDDAHVEHFRPKGRVDSYPAGIASYPGYYWLAYEWSNLFLCKSTTNSSIKRNFFPLTSGQTRNRSHQGSRVENPVLIDPGRENPRSHIKFQGEEIKGITRRGKKNIQLLDLRNGQLDEARRTKYRFLKGLKTSVDMLIASGTDIANPDLMEMLALLRYAVTPEAEFSSMAIDLLTGWPHL